MEAGFVSYTNSYCGYNVELFLVHNLKWLHSKKTNVKAVKQLECEPEFIISNPDM